MLRRLKRLIALTLAAIALTTGAVMAPAAVGAPGSSAEAYSTSSCRYEYKTVNSTRYSFQTCWRNYTAWEEWFQNGHDGYYRKQNYPYPGGWYYIGKTYYAPLQGW